jgi:cytochrome c biogenesis protein CcmG/thiol:disulfide interchange protein DsbE
MAAGKLDRRPVLAGLLGILAGLAIIATPAAAAPAPSAGQGGASPVDLSAYKGKVVYLDFWASWCVPCRESFPWMNDMQRQYASQGLVIVAVNLDQVHDDAETFLQKYQPEFTVRFDPAGHLAQDFKVRGMPTSALLGRDGKVLLVHEGFRSKDEDTLEQSIRDALR